MRTKSALTLADAQKMLAAAKVEAEKQKWKVTIAVVDDAGRLLLLERMDGARPQTAEIAHPEGPLGGGHAPLRQGLGGHREDSVPAW